MSKDGKVQGFPDLGSKLAAPAKKSIFERQKAEAEAKRLKEQRETAAVYQDFVRSFDDEGSDEEDTAQAGIGGTSGQAAGPQRRHFSSNLSGPGRGARFSGPGSLGPAPPAFSRKRNHEGSPPVGAMGSTMRAFEGGDVRKSLHLSDDEEDTTSSRAEERAKQKPTVHMSSLPLGISTTAIRALLPSTLNVDGVRIVPARMGGQERRSVSAIVTLAADTPASDVDTAVSSLQNRYLGRGFYLSISRHLSSAAISSNLPNITSTSLPFGARSVPISMGRGQPQMRGRGGFAPPPSLTHRGMQQERGPTDVQVTVIPPTNLKQLKLIHKMLELVMTHGPEFEALLMSRPEVQSDERWAWLWDPSSVGGIWYRWRLWEILTQGRDGAQQAKNGDPMQYIFNKSAPWVPRDRNLAFEYTTDMREFISDSDYDSSEDDDSGDEGRRRLQHLQGGALPPDQQAPSGADDGPSYLNPLHKAKLVHLLSRLPDSSAKLRRGDVARVTAFAIQHAGAGAEEVVDLLTDNVHEPFATVVQQESNEREANEALDTQDTRDGEETDPSSYKLVALFVISDTLSSSSTSGVRHAWRYRQLFENAFKKKRTFEHLGRLEKQLKWGRLRSEKWRRAVSSILNLWEGWSVFTSTVQEEFLDVFQNPPQTAAEKERATKAEAEAEKAEKAKSRWKLVTEASGEDMKADNDQMELDLDGEPMEEEDLDGVPMEDSEDDLNGQPVVEKDANSAEAQHPSSVPEPEQAAPAEEVPTARKARPRAADMFGDSDDE